MDRSFQRGEQRQPLASRFRLALTICLLGLPGVIAAAWQLVPTMLAQQGVQLPVTREVLMAAAALQSAILIALASAAGAWLAHRCGLHAPLLEALLAGTRPSPRQIRIALMTGAMGGLAGAALLMLAAQFQPADLRGVPAPPLAVRLLYGGLTEEILVRWGLMSVLAWVATLLVPDSAESGSAGHRWAVFSAIVLSSLLFAAGHLPAAAAMGSALSTPVLVWVMLANTGFGLIAGFLFWRSGLEAAMLAHLLAWAVLLS